MSANGRNPISIIVPCHRVIGASGKLAGYAGGVKRKEWLLQWERKVTGIEAASLFDLMPTTAEVGSPGRLSGTSTDLGSS